MTGLVDHRDHGNASGNTKWECLKCLSIHMGCQHPLDHLEFLFGAAIHLLEAPWYEIFSSICFFTSLVLTDLFQIFQQYQIFSEILIVRIEG